MRTILLFVLAVIAILAAACLIFVKEVDDGYIVEIGNHVYDPRGAISEWHNDFIRECSSVVTLPLRSDKAVALKRYLLMADRTGEPNLVVALQADDWFLVESEFSNAEPAVIVLKSAKDGFTKEGVWGGSSSPFKEAPTIRAYLLSQIPAVPASLVRCYEPVAPPFGPGK